MIRVFLILLCFMASNLVFCQNNNTVIASSDSIDSDIQLDEIAIKSDKSEIVTPGSRGNTYYLSTRAKEMQNPYEALREISRLTVIPTQKQITLVNGVVPLIMIDGKRYNRGIDSIDPQSIEAVEIIESPSSRYLKEGIQAIVNIKTKKIRKEHYTKINANTQQTIPILYGFTSGYYETGGKDFLFNLYGSEWYFDSDHTEIESLQRNLNYTKKYKGDRYVDIHNISITSFFDYDISANDYIAINPVFQKETDKARSNSKGILDEYSTNPESFTFTNKKKTSNYVFAFNSYYRHSFKNKSFIETIFRINKGGDNIDEERKEAYEKWEYVNMYVYKNKELSGSFDLNYSGKLGKQTFEMGSRIELDKEKLKMNQMDNSLFKHTFLNIYPYVEVSGKITDMLSYSVSLGIDYYHRKANEISFKYYRPVWDISTSYRINGNNSIRLNVSRNNSAPEISQLNPYNTSTDSLEVRIGNPYLQPIKNYSYKLSYLFNKNGFNLEPTLLYQYRSDLIDAVGETGQTGVYTRSYDNISNYKSLDIGLSLGYKHSSWGCINGRITNKTHYFYGQSGKSIFIYHLDFSFNYKKWNLNGYMNYTPLNYRIDTKVITRGSYGNINLDYRVNNSLTINSTLRYWMGPIKEKYYQESGTYYKYSYYNQTDRSYRFMIGLSYYFQRNKQPERFRKSF